MFTNIKAVIFDLDGTLIDSMWVWEKIDVEFLEKRGISLPEDLREKISHLSFDETAKYFKVRFNLFDSIDEIIAEWNLMAFHEYSNNVSLKPGARRFLELLKSNNIKIGLATSNSNLLLEIALKKNSIFNFFDTIVTTNEVSRGKDFPDVYLLAADRLGVSPENSLVFEDIFPAVLSAKAAGMKVIGVYDNAALYETNKIIKAVDRFIFKYDELLDAI